MENEVIFPRDSVFIVKSVNTSGQYPIIYLQEDVEDGYNTTQKPRDAVRDMQESYSGNGDMQGVSKEDTNRNYIGQIRPQSSAPAGQRDTVRAGRG